MSDYFSIGRIVNVHGIKGELKVFPTTDDIKRFERLKKIFVELKGISEYEIENLRYHKNFIILKLKNIDDRNAAESLRNAIIKVERKDAIPLSKDEYFIKDLYDMSVFTSDGEFLGIISDIIPTGANDVYVIKKDETEDLLIPAIKKCVLSINLEENKMIVKLLEGLR